MALPELTEHLYVHYAGSAVQHLFAVAAGLDSMVVGEAQILGQLRAAYAAADARGHGRAGAARAVQQALRVGKRVHAGTGIDAAGASVVSEALADATRRARWRPRRAAGRRRRRRARWARSPRPTCAAPSAAEVVVLNRSAERAQRLAENTAAHRHPGPLRPLEALAAELAAADLLVACTGAVGTVVARETVAAAVVARDGRPLAVCDLGLPRDVDPAVAALPGVTRVDLATLQAPARRRRPRRGRRDARRSWWPRRRRPTWPPSARPRSPRRSPRCAAAPPR